MSTSQEKWWLMSQEKRLQLLIKEEEIKSEIKGIEEDRKQLDDLQADIWSNMRSVQDKERGIKTARVWVRDAIDYANKEEVKMEKLLKNIQKN
ncbi:hypothetical protein Lser_V15G39829 [Lactuca serriola]